MYDNGYGVGDYPSQPQNSNQDQISKQICKVHGKDKVIDFRDGLHYANYVDFANIHGVGGKKHAPNSTIQVVLCDYSKEKVRIRSMFGSVWKWRTLKFCMKLPEKRILANCLVR